MTRTHRALAAVLLAGLAGHASAATKPSSHACAADALVQAQKLLAFHTDDDERARVSGPAKPLPSIVNPANAKQRFDVLEVWGYVYKGQYRMRLEYYRLGNDCVLMGQEILEHASL
ncbi:hypothetical protein ASD78_03005 [Lysobacter sp. Root667]|uniref:hypothetical protein n=1 Tax=Lysobacter sp. Root667 TaxID=1736581 RepID=UPI0006F69821|nr:hypothetical protein [Lysobacter sp. Root667]KRA76624.1 hypothetical protein ASD78_03005 [Lysobacter sp. Root667]